MVDNGLVVQELTAQDPVTSHEAREMGANVADGAGVVEISEVRPVTNSRFLRSAYERNRTNIRSASPTLRRVLMDESTAVAQVSAKMLSLVFVRRAYLIRYSR